MNKYTTSIVITTKNRKYELSKAIESCLKLQGEPEIFVFDDGSEDGTYEMVKNKYPSVHLHREEKSIGLIDARTKAATLVKGDVIFSIDDDACFSDTQTILDIMPFFNHPKVAVVTIPYVDVYKSDKIEQKGKGTSKDIYTCAYYRGTAHALRKDVFHKMGGYRKNLDRGGEEIDFSIRLYKNDYWVRIGNSGSILHYESQNRDKQKIIFYSARNIILIAWIYTPPIIFLPYLLNIIIKLFINGFRDRGIKSIFGGLINVFKQIIKGKTPRSPMTMRSFISFKILVRKGSIRKYK